MGRYHDPVGEYQAERDRRLRAVGMGVFGWPGGDLGVFYVGGPATPAKRDAGAAVNRPGQPRGIDYEEAVFMAAPMVRAACRETLRIAGRELPGSVDGVELRYFVRSYRPSLRYAFSAPEPSGGLADPTRGLIWICATLTMGEAIRAVSHEAKHFAQIGYGMTPTRREADATTYAVGFWRRHGARITAWASTYGRLTA